MRGNPDYIKMLIEKLDERRGRRVSVYSGDSMDIPVSDQEYKRYKTSMFLLIFLIAVLYFGAGFLNNPGMFEIYVVIPYVAAFFSYVYFCINLFQLPREKDKFRFGEVGLLFGRLKMASIFLGFSIGACILGESFYLSNLSVEYHLETDYIFLALMLCLIVLVFILTRIQNRIAKKINSQK